MSRTNRTRQMAWDVGVPVTVALATVAVFLPALWNDFVWDDLPMFPENPHYRGLGWTQLRWMWTTFHIREFMPFTWMTYGLDYVLWGVEPFGYHLSNLFLHALSAVAVYFLARRLLRLGMSEFAGDPAWMIPLGAGVATLIFAVHPLRAEPVAWVAARGSILGGLFFVLTTLAYLAAVARPGGPRRGPFLASLGFFVLALLSRSTTIIVPVVLLVLDVYPLRRLGGGPGWWVGPPVRHVLWEKVPFMVLAAAIVPLALLARYEAGPMMGQRLGDVHVGAATAAWAIVFYLVKTLVPAGLSPLYERPPHLDPLTWPFLASGAGVVAITALLLALRRRWPAGLASWLCYLAILGPTLGLVPFGLQLAADRYTYVACLGWAMLVGAGVVAWCRGWRRRAVATPMWALTVGLSLGVVGGLAVLSWNRVQVWRDPRTLWAHAAAVDSRSAVAHTNLGMLLEREGKAAQALEHYRRAVSAWPFDARMHANLGGALARHGRAAEGLEHLRKAVELWPEAPDMRLRLGTLLWAQGKVVEAIAQYREAVRITPDLPAAHLRLGLALAAHGEHRQAIVHYETARQLLPDSPDVHLQRAHALAAEGELEQAIAHYEAALKLRPGFVEASAEHDRAVSRLGGRPRGSER